MQSSLFGLALALAHTRSYVIFALVYARAPAAVGRWWACNRLDNLSTQSAVAFSPCMFRRASSSEDPGVRVIGLGLHWVAGMVSSRPVDTYTFGICIFLAFALNPGAYSGVGLCYRYSARRTNYYLLSGGNHVPLDGLIMTP